MTQHVNLVALLLCLGLMCPVVTGIFMDKLASRKLCVDDDCVYTISLARAEEDYNAPDCRFINIKKGQLIYVYSKLVKEDDSGEFWAGSVYGEQYEDHMGTVGYFPSSLVSEQHVYQEANKTVCIMELCKDKGLHMTHKSRIETGTLPRQLKPKCDPECPPVAAQHRVKLRLPSELPVPQRGEPSRRAGSSAHQHGSQSELGTLCPLAPPAHGPGRGGRGRLRHNGCEGASPGLVIVLSALRCLHPLLPPPRTGGRVGSCWAEPPAPQRVRLCYSVLDMPMAESGGAIQPPCCQFGLKNVDRLVDLAVNSEEKGERKVQKEVAIQGYSKQPWQKIDNSVVQAVKLGHPMLFAAYVHFLRTTCLFSEIYRQGEAIGLLSYPVGGCNGSAECLTIREQRDLEQLVVYP
ncbi:PREDICTED: otoraplin [Haliaeetus leucocephalus]|nr:PREDICTED: otoraplin [Haliaeetus leucocephalus]